MKTKNRLNLLVVLGIITLIKRLNFSDSIKFSILYIAIRFIIGVILKSINRVNYESTLIGIIDKVIRYCYKNYFPIVRRCFYIYIFFGVKVLSLFTTNYIPAVLYTFFGIAKPVKILSVLWGIVLFLCNLITDYISVYGK